METVPRLKKTFITLTQDQRLYSTRLPLVGLTGGVGSGKSSVTNILRKQGLIVICADELVRRIYDLQEVKEFVAKHFPAAFTQEETIDFPILRSLVFQCSTLRKKLEIFIYAHLPVQFKKEASAIQSQEVIFYDVPLLFEKGLHQKIDLIVCIYCHENQQRMRTITRDKVDESLVDRMIKAQWPIEKKKECAHKIIFNISTKEELASNVEKFLKDILIWPKNV